MAGNFLPEKEKHILIWFKWIFIVNFISPKGPLNKEHNAYIIDKCF